MLKRSAALVLLGLALIVGSLLPWGRETVAQDAGGAGAAAAGDPTRGRALFMAKGCAQCHRHGDVPGSGKFGGGYPKAAPDLTARPGDPAYQRAWLRDPRAVDPQAAMPNLGLSDAEIADVVAFLQQGQAAR